VLLLLLLSSSLWPATSMATPPAPPDPHPARTCLAKYAACVLTNAHPGRIPQAIAQCDENFSACVAPSSARVDACGAVKATGRRACEQSFDERTCAPKDEGCRAAARTDRRECVSLVEADKRACVDAGAGTKKS
jgi:hypothetical protein